MARDDLPLLVDVADGGNTVFRVRWSEPVEVEFDSRFVAENFRAALQASGRTVGIDDGACGACVAHHAARHGCPSCGADLSLRVAPDRGRSVVRPPTRLPGPDRFLIPREQHRIRAEIAQAAAARTMEAGLVHADALIDAADAS